MKKSTYADRLNALLGIKPEEVEKLAAPDNPAMETVKKKKQEELKAQPALYGYTDDEFEEIRIMQGTLYFLQAPELFTIKRCPMCNEWFAVSRQAVGYCSYGCMDRKFKELGLVFRKGGDLEALAQDVWKKNEPLWAIKLLKLQNCLQKIIEDTNLSSTEISEEETISQTTPIESSTIPPTDSQSQTGTIGSEPTLKVLKKI